MTVFADEHQETAPVRAPVAREVEDEGGATVLAVDGVIMLGEEMTREVARRLRVREFDVRNAGDVAGEGDGLRTVQELKEPRQLVADDRARVIGVGDRVIVEQVLKTFSRAFIDGVVEPDQVFRF